MSNEEKEEVFFNIFKIKKVESQKTIKCPINNCGKTFVSHANLGSHFELKHKFLSNYGIEIKNGKIEYSEKAMNMALYLGKVYSEDVKKIINGMKLNIK